MTGKVFVDSNVLIYAHNIDAGPKHRLAAQCLNNLWQSRLGRLSTQVMQEFYVNVTRKIPKPLSAGLAREILRQYNSWVESLISTQTVLRAAEIADSSGLSFWDAMIVAAAEEVGAQELLTEDLSHGQVIVGVRITSPFR
ncbi:MAG TPA: PIN domain-containing protein [Candidatus Acidoferrales bacterium]|nr:PIN domain-containing protein [Candidatus Acidoferrales bacterium]